MGDIQPNDGVDFGERDVHLRVIFNSTVSLPLGEGWETPPNNAVDFGGEGCTSG